MHKQIHIKATHGSVDALSAPNRGTFDFSTGSQAALNLSAELNGKYGESFDNRPVFVIPFETADHAEQFKTFVENFAPSQIGPEGKDEEF